MSNPRFPIRCGMTLVELLVVVAILGLLAVTVLPAFSNGSDARAARQAVAVVTSQISKAQAAAIGKPLPAGIWIQPLGDGRASLEMALARQPAPYRGDTFSATVTGSAVTSGTFALAFNPSEVTLLTVSSTPAFVSTGDLVQFGGSGPHFEMLCPSSALVSGTEWSARLRTDFGQTPHNTVFPVTSGGVSFTIQRKPVRGGAATTIQSGMAIDLAWSGLGLNRFGQAMLLGDGQVSPGPDPDVSDNLPPMTGYTPGQAIVLTFNAAGGVNELFTLNPAPSWASSQTRLTIHEPLFLLVGRVDRCGLPYNPSPTEDAPGANWQYPDSFWIAVDPRTGLTKTADTRLRVSTARESQRYIRSGLSVPGL
jgi:prepilin-type N-terminal cleavage/methylation domain-containing protein